MARELASKLSGTTIVSLDSYYRGFAEIPLEARKKVNFDRPDALDWPLLHRHLELLASGKPFEEPVYSFADYARTARTNHIEPAEFLIVEGLFVFHWPELRSLIDTKIFVDTAASVCFNRRIQRDVAERGRTPDTVCEQYLRTVKPSAEWFVLPTRKFADLLVSGEDPLANSTAAVLGAIGKPLSAVSASC